MTRETKIGLLVGLTFIIVVGILLSDHIADSNRPPQALLSDVGNNVRNSVAIPQPAGMQTPAPTNAAPGTITASGPTAPVPTHEELKQTIAPAGPPASNLIVDIGPGGSVKSLTQPTAVAAGNSLVSQSTMPLAAVDQPTALDSTPDSNNAGVTPITLTDAPAKALKQYKVVSGDTLSKLARHFYGTSSHAAIAAILAANPQLKGNAARLAVGRTYAIPEFDKASSSPTGHSEVALVDTNTLAVHPTTRPAAQALVKTRIRSAGGTYTVKSGDTLWKIAASQLGSFKQIKQIEELNPGLSRRGQLKIGTVLKLPAKTVASVD